MNQISKRQNVFFQGLIWQFFDTPKAILRAWRNFLWFNLNYFSLPILLKTFFSHWRRYYYPYGKKWEPWRWVEAFIFNNIMSRSIGMVIRTVFIIIGLLIEILILIGGMIVFIGWLALPFLLIFGFIFGVKLILF